MKTVREVADMMGVNQSYVRRLCKIGAILAHKIGRDWVITDLKFNNEFITNKEVSAKGFYKRKKV